MIQPIKLKKINASIKVGAERFTKLCTQNMSIYQKTPPTQEKDK